jgi:HAD superfamily hydrolase (TIGR01509 family)
MSIKAIIFDMGRVLVDLDISKGFFALFINDFSKGVDEAVQQVLNNSVFQKYNQGLLTPAEFYENLKNIYKVDISFDDFAIKWCSIFSVMPGMRELIEQLSGKYRLGLLSDTDPLHWKFLNENYEILKFFKNPVLSFQAKKTKSSAEIFLLAAKSVQAAPEECVYIDDLPANVSVANKIGMKGIKFISAEQLISELKKQALL